MIVVTIDTLRADHVTPQIAPALDQLRKTSIEFTDAVTVAPLTLPAHASLFTGLYPPRHGVHDNHVSSLPEDVPTYAARLKQRGYATGAFVSAVMLDHRYGLDRGFDVYDDRIDGPERAAVDTLGRAGTWLQTASRPFFLWIHLFEPHAPYRTGTYASEVTDVDSELATFFTTLHARQLWDDIVLSVTSDHGESLGEHGEKTHGFFVYDSTIRIPWLLHAPGRRAARFAPQVRIVDQMATIMALADAGASAPGGIDGVNLLPFVDGNRSPDLEAYSETYLPRDQFNWSELRALRRAGRKFIDAPQPELYDVQADPAESANLYAEERPNAESLARQLAAVERSGSHNTRVRSSNDVEADKFMALGYIGFSPPLARARADRGADPKAKLPVYTLTMDAIELSETGRPDAALHALRRARALDADVTQVHFLEGAILGGRGDFRGAAAALERTLALNPRFVAARLKLALAYLRLGHDRAAEQQLDAVLRDEPANYRAYHDLAAIAYARGEFDHAEALERKALAIKSDYFDGWNALGAALIMKHQASAAVDALQKATDINPRSGQALHNLSLALAAAARRDEAERAAVRACAADRQYCR
ncbi:MAG: hypothetical protein AUH43_24530 [Acidobacteria bacterium 13_1_40CM_65_14]|nr:MAG: hypothetical protein AUH43_24530 [Acidobacteria bacterium 13_1_40CM_65_14]